MTPVDAIDCALKIKLSPLRMGSNYSIHVKSYTLVIVCLRRYVNEGGLGLCRNKQVSEEVQQQHVASASSRPSTQHQQHVMHQ